LKKYEKTLVLP